MGEEEGEGGVLGRLEGEGGGRLPLPDFFPAIVASVGCRRRGVLGARRRSRDEKERTSEIYDLPRLAHVKKHHTQRRASRCEWFM